MGVLGIIAEYNPFHNGHLYQLEESRKALNPDCTVAVMSGNFTQRGEPAMFSKWLRAEAAVKCGIDLVIELPFVFACNNAEYFAYGAVDILERLGCITHISFGSESGNIGQLEETAFFLSHESEEFKKHIRHFSDTGMSYPKARQEALAACLGREFSDLLSSPNNILAVEYLKQLKLRGSNIIPFTVKRFGAEYHDSSFPHVIENQAISSASAIRKAFYSQTENEVDDDTLTAFLPEPVGDIFHHNRQNIRPASAVDSDLYKILSSMILSTDISRLKEIFSVNEGLENKLKNAVRISDSLDELKLNLISKRYTATRINRILMHLLTGLRKSSFTRIIEGRQNYARLLAFNQKGAALIKKIKNSDSVDLPVITNINKESDSLLDCQLLLSYDTLASDLYNLIMEKNIYDCSDSRQKPFFLK